MTNNSDASVVRSLGCSITASSARPTSQPVA